MNRTLVLCTFVAALAAGTLPALAAPEPKAQATLPPSPPPAVLPAVPAVAPGYGAPKVTPASANIVGITQRPFVGITLQSAISMALVHNADLAVAQGNRRIAGYEIRAARGAYDVNFMVEPMYRHSETAPTNPVFAGPDFGADVGDVTQVQAGISGILRSGTRYSITASGQRTTDNNIVDSFNPYYPTAFSVTVSQPLAKNSGINPASHALELAEISADSANRQTLVTAQQTLAGVETAYWNLVSAWRNVAIQEESLKQAIAQQQSNVRLAKRGVSAPIDAVESSAQVSAFQANVFSALQNVAALQNSLKALLVTDSNDPLWQANLVPTTPVLQLPATPTLKSVVMQALRNRPELAQVRDSLRAADVNLAFAKNQTKPDISLDLGYTTNGLAGNAVDTSGNPFLKGFPPAPDYLRGGIGQSFSNLFSNKFPTYSIGLKFQVPIGDDTARANLAAAREQARVAAVQAESTMQRIAIESRNALQNYLSAQYRLAAAHAATQSSEAVLASEERRFRNGVSTTFLVLQREVEVANNRGLELRAQTDLNNAVVELQRVTGTILGANDVTLTTVGEGALNQ